VHAGTNVGLTLGFEIVSPPRDLVDMFSSSRRRLPNRHILVVTNGQVSHQRDCMFSSSRRRLPNRHILVVTNGHPFVHWKRLCSPNRPSALGVRHPEDGRRIVSARLAARSIRVSHPWPASRSFDRPVTAETPKCSAALLRDTYCILINDTLFMIDYSNHRLSFGVMIR
jgi:hypothetical protein